MEPMTELDTASLREYYRTFARVESAGTSPIYAAWAAGVADDDEIIGLLLELPRPKRQANLLFAAARHLGAEVGPYAQLRTWLIDHWSETRALMLSRSTQTNEAGRCAVLLPILSRIGRPLSLIEVGASAGLCLYPDRYSYIYRTGPGTSRLDPVSGPSAVTLECEISGAAPPDRLPEVVWRAGIDLNPIDITDPEERAWLRSLIWPEHEFRRDRLDAAAAVAAADPPRLVSGDLCEEIEQLIAEAPAGSQVVVYHSAVLAYLDSPKRAEFASIMRAHDEVVWVSNEGRSVLPEIGDQLVVHGITDNDGRFVLAVDGIAAALTAPHGQSWEALRGASPR